MRSLGPLPLLWLATLSRCELLAPRALRARFLDYQQDPQVQSDQQPMGYSEPLECFEVTHPIETHEGLGIGNEIVEPNPEPVQSTTVRLVEHSFGNSYGHPWVGHYEPPSEAFSQVFINVTVTSRGHQFDRLATMWLGDVEIWRTSTAEPTDDSGIVWYILKDMTAYHSLWTQPQSVIFDLGNLINDKYTAPFDVTVDVVFYTPETDRRAEHGLLPADLIVPVSAKKSGEGSPSAFTFPGDTAETNVRLPLNSGRAVLTVAATGQAEEEFWWSNVPESTTGYFNYAEGEKLPGLGSFREVLVRIDGQVAGLVWPFPVVFTGGIAPPLHRPMVGLQAFDLREYEIDITPWLGVLSDGEEHSVNLEVFAIDDTDRDNPQLVHARTHWVLSGKIFVWFSASEITSHEAPETHLEPLDYKSDVSFLSPSAVDYQQTVSRDYFVTGFHVSDDYRPVTWSQKYQMINNGALRDSGYYQNVNASYSGHGLGTLEGHRITETQFSYPTNTSYHYFLTPESGQLNLEATLSQEISLNETLNSPFTTGAEQFLGSEHPFDLSSLHAWRVGHATFSQDPGHSSGTGLTDQHYKLSAGSSSGLEAAAEVYLPLYERITSVANHAVTKDQERIRGRLSRHPAMERSYKHQGPSEFAPLALTRLGGVNLFIKPSNYTEEA